MQYKNIPHKHWTKQVFAISLGHQQLSWPYPLIFQNYVDDSFIKVLRIGRI